MCERMRANGCGEKKTRAKCVPKWYYVSECEYYVWTSMNIVFYEQFRNWITHPLLWGRIVPFRFVPFRSLVRSQQKHNFGVSKFTIFAKYSVEWKKKIFYYSMGCLYLLVSLPLPLPLPLLLMMILLPLSSENQMLKSFTGKPAIQPVSHTYIQIGDQTFKQCINKNEPSSR